MTIKSDIGDMTITVNADEFARIIALASHHETLRKELALTQEKNRRMRAELTKYHAICERNRTSGAGASDEPQTNETNAQAKTDAVLLKNETEGSVSGGERAGISEVAK